MRVALLGRWPQRGHVGKCMKRNKRCGRRHEDAQRETQEGTEKQIQEDTHRRGHCWGQGWEWLLEGGMLCCGVLGGTVAVGDPRWSRDTPKGTATHGRSRLEHEMRERKEWRKKRVRKQGQQQETITYQAKLLCCPLPHPRTERNVWSKRGEGVQGREVLE